MQGITLGDGIARIASKDQLKEKLTSYPYDVLLEPSGYRGDEYVGPVAEAPAGDYAVVGPDPLFDRRWHAVITVMHNRSIVVT